MSKSIVKKQQLKCLACIILIINLFILAARFGIETLGYLIAPFIVFETFFIIFGVRFSIVIGRFLRNRFAKGQAKVGKNIWKISLFMQIGLGLIGTSVIGFFGTFAINSFWGLNRSVLIIWLFAILFPFRMISEAYDGYISGRGNDLVGGFAAIIREVLVLVFSIIFTSIFSGYGENVALLLKHGDYKAVYVVCGFMVSAVISELVVIIFLMLIRLNLIKKAHDYDDYSRRNEVSSNIIVNIWAKRAHEIFNYILLAAPVGLLLGYINFAPNKELAVSQLYGSMLGAFLLPGVFIVFSLLVFYPIFSKTIGFMKKREMRKSRTVFQTGFHFCFIIGLFCASFLIAVSGIISEVLAPEAQDFNINIILFGFIVLLLIISIYMIKIMETASQSLVLLPIQAVATVVFGIAGKVLISKNIPSVRAVLIAMLIALALQAALMSVFVIWRMDMVIDPVNNMLVPLIINIVCCVICSLIVKFARIHLGNVFSSVLCFILMFFMNLIMLLFARNIREPELNYVPLGNFIYSLGQMLHVM